MEFFIVIVVILILAISSYLLIKKNRRKNEKKDDSLDVFFKAIELYLEKNHPKIKIDYKNIELPKDEKNLKIKQTLAVENIMEQFYDYKFPIISQESISKEKLWSSYEFNNTQKNSYPNDWLKRKELAYIRDNSCCKRCGQQLITVNEVHTSFVRPIKDGGGYNFENILTLCSDCNRIIESKANKLSVINSLKLYDNLLSFIKD